MLVSAYRRFRGAEAVGCGVGLGPGGVRAHATATHPNKCEMSNDSVSSNETYGLRHSSDN